MTTIRQADPTAEAVKNMIPPAQSGIDYVMKRYIVEGLASGNANAFAFAVQNPEGVDCVVTNVIVDITTAGGTVTSVLDVDVVADATSTGDKIIDGLDLNATGTSDRVKNPGTNGDGKPVKWGKKGSATDFLTGKILVAGAPALVGEAEGLGAGNGASSFSGLRPTTALAHLPRATAVQADFITGARAGKEKPPL